MTKSDFNKDAKYWFWNECIFLVVKGLATREPWACPPPSNLFGPKWLTCWLQKYGDKVMFQFGPTREPWTYPPPVIFWTKMVNMLASKYGVQVMFQFGPSKFYIRKYSVNKWNLESVQKFYSNQSKSNSWSKWFQRHLF